MLFPSRFDSGGGRFDRGGWLDVEVQIVVCSVAALVSGRTLQLAISLLVATSASMLHAILKSLALRVFVTKLDTLRNALVGVLLNVVPVDATLHDVFIPVVGGGRLDSSGNLGVSDVVVFAVFARVALAGLRGVPGASLSLEQREEFAFLLRVALLGTSGQGGVLLSPASEVAVIAVSSSEFLVASGDTRGVSSSVGGGRDGVGGVGVGGDCVGCFAAGVLGPNQVAVVSTAGASSAVLLELSLRAKSGSDICADLVGFLVGRGVVALGDLRSSVDVAASLLVETALPRFLLRAAPNFVVLPVGFASIGLPPASSVPSACNAMVSVHQSSSQKEKRECPQHD